MAARKLLVVGATGAQGGAVIDALLANKSNFDIYGLTRNKASPSALKLAERNVKMVEGDVKKPTPIFEKIGKVWGVFSMTNIGPDEEEEAKPLIDCAIAKGVQFFVFTSVYRGAKSDVDPTYVPHFITKYNIEKYLIEKAAKSPQKMGWTILRPAGFMDYFGPGFAGKSMARFVHQMGDKKLQVVYTKDIGKVAVYALENTEKCNGKAFPLAGDSLNFQEMNKIFHEEVGHNLPMAPSFLVSLFFYFSNDLGKMARWFKEGGYNLDLDRSEEFPRPIDFRTWLRTASKWNVKK